MKPLLTAALLFTALLASAQTTQPRWHSPLETMDSDRDGVPDSKDACPHTPPSRPVLANGCAAFELAQRPEILMRPLTDAISKLTTRLGTDTSASGLIFTLNGASQQFDVAASQVRATQVCEAGGTFSAGLRDLSQAQVTLQGMVNVARATLSVPRPRGAYGDASEADLQEIDLEQRQTELTPLISRATDAASVLSTMCRGISGPTARGTITRIDNANRRIELDGGSTIIALTEATKRNAKMFPDDLVVTTGAAFDDHTVLAASVDNATPAVLKYNPAVDCMQLRFMPVQFLPPVPSFKDLMIHDPEAYRYGSNYQVEAGMHFTSSATGCPEALQPFPNHAHSLDITLNFVSTAGGGATVSLGDYIQAPDMTAEIPFSSINLNYPISMKVDYIDAVIDYDANAQPHIGSYTVIKTETYNLTLRPLHGVCSALYNTTKLSLPDDDLNAFKSVKMVAEQYHFAQPDPGWPLTFKAKGFQVYGNNGNLTNSFPNIEDITDDLPFALFNQFGPDFYSDAILAEATVGVDKASGLMWPRITSLRNGHEFSYSCELPAVVRDLISLCPAQAEDDYHRLPFEGGFSDWQLSQGNSTQFSHQGAQAYAYDFTNNVGTPIYAARGGVVSFVRSNQSGNSYPQPSPGCNSCQANAIRIQHQDGTFTSYLHFPQNGVFYNVGDQVPRGAEVGVVGNTGYSTAPHVHIQVNPVSDLNPGANVQSIQFNFQLKLSAQGSAQSCVIPVTGQAVWSTN